MVPNSSDTKTEAAGELKRSASVLIVEDEALIASYIQEVLEESGFTVAGVASSGAEAMSLASANPPDLALVDVKLAGPMDGIEVAKLMRSRFNVMSIFLSGICDPETMDGPRTRPRWPSSKNRSVPARCSTRCNGHCVSAKPRLPSRAGRRLRNRRRGVPRVRSG